MAKPKVLGCVLVPVQADYLAEEDTTGLMEGVLNFIPKA